MSRSPWMLALVTLSGCIDSSLPEVVPRFRKAIAIDRTKVGNRGAPASLTDFPLLYSVTDPDLRSTANGGHVASPDGYDILFGATDPATCGGPDSCMLDHEVEKYSADTGELIAWIRLPSLNTISANSDTTILVYYGSGGITRSTQKADAVWDRQFRSVWHLKETSGGPGAIKDSTANANHGTDRGSPLLGASGKIGNAVDFRGTGHLEIANEPSFHLERSEAVTVCAWVNPSSFPASGSTILGKMLQMPFRGWFFGAYDTSGAPDGLYLQMGNREPGNRISLAVLDALSGRTGTWHHACFTYDGSSAAKGVKIYFDGDSQSTTVYEDTLTDSILNDQPLQIGALGMSDFPLDGTVDEARVSNVVRSADWIKTEYNNQNSPSTFYTITPAERAR